MKDVFGENYFYKFVYYVPLMFGTRMTIVFKTQKVMVYAIPSIWCLAIVGNQIDYQMKTWIIERKEISKQDMTFEKIIRFDFWTYNLVYFLGCFLSMIGRKIEMYELLRQQQQQPQIFAENSVSYGRKTATVFLLVVGNLIPSIFSYDFVSIQKKSNSTYNLLFQDICKLGILTVDVQFVWFCWCLEDRLSKLNDYLRQLMSLRGKPAVTTTTNAVWRRTTTTITNYRREIRQINVAYGKLTDTAKSVNGVCQERVLMNMLCYMFNTICGLFNTISAYRTQGTPTLVVVIHLLWVMNCVGRITLVCFAASSVVDQDDRLHNLAQITKEVFDTECNHWEMKQLLKRLTYSKIRFHFCGMVTIDKTLLSSAVISVISYLVIVLQYNYS